MPRLKTDEVADVLQVARVRILRDLARRGAVRVSAEALEIDDELAARDLVLAQLAWRAFIPITAQREPTGPASASGARRIVATSEGAEIVHSDRPKLTYASRR